MWLIEPFSGSTMPAISVVITRTILIIREYLLSEINPAESNKITNHERADDMCSRQQQYRNYQRAVIQGT